MDETRRGLSRPLPAGPRRGGGWSLRTSQPRAASSDREAATVPPRSHMCTQKRNTDCRLETPGPRGFLATACPISGQPTVDLLGTHSGSWGASAHVRACDPAGRGNTATAAAFLGSKQRFKNATTGQLLNFVFEINLKSELAGSS